MSDQLKGGMMSLLETYNFAVVAVPATLALLLVSLVIKQRHHHQ